MVMSSRQYLIDSAAKHQVFLLRYSGGVYNKMLKFVEQSRKETVKLVREANTDWSRDRLKRFNTELERVNKLIYTGMSKNIIGNMIDLAKYESLAAKNTFEKATKLAIIFNTPTLVQLQTAAFTSIIDSIPGVDKKSKLTVGKALEEFGENKTNEIVSLVRVGFALGKTTRELSQEISNTITSLVPRQAQVLARTITNHVASNSRGEFYKQNSELLTGYQVVATLDDRTSFTCFVPETEVINLGTLENVSRAKYTGEIITITTASGKKLTGTPNHPILTPEGFLPLGKLNPSKHVVYTVSPDIIDTIRNNDVTMQANIGTLFDTFNKPAISNIIRKRPSASDFYGDGVRMNDEINIACPYSNLLGYFISCLYKPIVDLLFSSSHIRASFNTACLITQSLLSWFIMVNTSKVTTSFFEDSVEPPFTMSHALENLGRSNTCIKHVNSSLSISDTTNAALTSLSVYHNTCTLKQTCNSGSGSAILPSEGSSGCSSLVFEDNIISVTREFKSCHVYSLGNSLSLYIAGGIVVKNCGALDGTVFDEEEFEYPPYHWNCRSTYIAVLDKQYDLGSDIGGQRPSKNEDGVELVDTKTTYNSWLKAQSKEFQNEVLGDKRAELFRAGMSVDKFVDHNYRPLSLEGLRIKDVQHS